MQRNALTLYRRYFWVGCIAITFAACAFGRTGTPTVGGTDNTIPFQNHYTGLGGIVFPGFNTAAGVNAAALANGKKGTSIQVTGAPALQSGDNSTYTGSLATSSSRVGWGIGYNALQSSSGTLNHGMFAGVGFTLGPLSLGMGMRDAAIVSGFNPEVDFGATLVLGGDFHAAAVVYDVATSHVVAAGVGYGRAKRENVELNVRAPVPGSADYTLTFAATFYAGPFGTHFRTSYLTSSRTYNHTLGGLLWLGDHLNVMIQLTTPRALGLGLTYIF